MPRNSPVDLDRMAMIIERDGADGELTLGEAAALVASRVKDSRDSMRTARNRVRMQMVRSHALAGKDLHHGGLECLPNGNFTVDEIGRWARKRYSGRFDDLPSKRRVWPMVFREPIGFGGSTQNERMPGTLEGAQEEIRRLREREKQMRDDREDAEAKRKRDLAARFKRK